MGGIGEDNKLMWVVMITSAENRAWPGDLVVGRYKEAGLPAPSIIRLCKIATIEARHAERLGRIKPGLATQVISAIGNILGLGS
jgi:mRNA interferase MazF